MYDKNQLGESKTQKGGQNMLPVNPKPEEARPKPPNKGDDTRPFPIQGGPSYRLEGRMIYPPPSRIPWWLAEEAYAYYSERFGTDQSIERLAQLGGFGREELLHFLRRGVE